MPTIDEMIEETSKIVRKSDDYWIKHYCCVNNAYYNVYKLNNKKTHKVRCGGVWFKGEQLFGSRMDLTTRQFHYRSSHAWVETKDGKIIDWVINEYLEEPDLKKVVWDKKEIEALGFEYRYYDNEVAIERKLRKQFGKSGEMDRRGFGEWWGSQISAEKRRVAKEKAYNEFVEKYKHIMRIIPSASWGDYQPCYEYKHTNGTWVSLMRDILNFPPMIALD